LVKAMIVFWIAVIMGVGIFIVGVYLPAVRVLARVSDRDFLRAALPSMAMGFSTTSSLATLPTMLQAAEGDLHMSRTVAGFALPLGASLNRAGSALYQSIAVLFLAELYGVHLGAAGLFQAAAAVFLASLTVASVPYASVVSLQPAMSTVGLPLAGLNLLIGLDRIPDMFRTMTNVTGHLAAAAVVAHGEGEQLG
ncbi:MAG TPA: cation:dicarboxylase symporter family transporter, partial [Gemmatimonadales bacterium]|nr:cation:dicarboxylase symporter family transporter [Gemmatimonadales bacterium]